MDKYLGVIPERKNKSYIAYSAFFIITTSFYFLFDIPFFNRTIFVSWDNNDNKIKSASPLNIQ